MNKNPQTGSAAKSKSGRGNRVVGTGIQMRRRMKRRLKLGVLRIRGLACRVLCRVLGFRWSRQALLRLCQAEPWLLASEDAGGGGGGGG
jgi:hypothetical protein